MSILRSVLKTGGIVVGALVLIFLGVAGYASLRWDKNVDRRIPAMTAKADSATLARGEFLFTTGIGCWQCHGHDGDKAPPSGGMKFDLTVLSPSLGVYYAANITPDVETGIGGWTDGEIVRAIREGISKDGRVLFPIMPVDPLSGLADDDVLALVAYLRTLPPVKNKVPAREPSLFAKTLMTLGVIGPMKEQTEPIVAPERAMTAKYGEYVAKHASLCSDCHTPRNLQDGSFYYDSLLAGSSFQFGADDGSPVLSFAPNITPDVETGIGKWTEEEFMRMLRTGVGPDGKVRSKHMPYAYYGLWDTLELKAVYTYLRSIPSVRRTTPPTEYAGDALSSDQLVKGKGIFNSTCSACHGAEGKGAAPTNVVMAEVTPSLTDDELTEFITEGTEGLRMPGFAKTLSKDELKMVVTYIRSWEHPAVASK
ncbi:MAG: c-type cytochrome [Bacteroidetes bacterium]|nr:c-type cytochrome [Bacteroidota bacterium]MCW5894962.1 c-type cytochrome [Bacteroidota bacterium]